MNSIEYIGRLEPAYSSDLNVIKKVWNVIKKRRGSHNVDFENFEDFVYSEWNDLPTQYPKRISKCKKNNGNITKY